MLQFSNQQVQVGTVGANSPKHVLPDSGHGFRSYSQVCCRHFQCGSFGAEAGEKCRMGECCPSVTCCCMPAGTGRSSTWHGLLHVPDEFLSVSWARVLHGPAGYRGSSCVPADTCRDILGLAPLLCSSCLCVCLTDKIFFYRGGLQYVKPVRGLKWLHAVLVLWV